jgi:hypothetical protein
VINIERAKKTPSELFAAPRGIVEHKHIAKSDKIEILLRWRHDAQQLETAQSENMQSSEDSRLQEVLKALRQLGHDDR